MSKLITREELIKICDLKEDEYTGVDLDQFIEDYELDKESVGKYNVKELLKVYHSNDDYQYLFEKKSVDAKETPYNEISVIAAFKNYGTSTKSILINCADGKLYKSEYEYIFSNVSKYPFGELSNHDMNEIVEKLKTQGVFSWTSKKSDDAEITDWQKATIAIEYLDGTIFRLEYEGRINECAPVGFEDLFDYLYEIE